MKSNKYQTYFAAITLAGREEPSENPTWS